MAVSYSFSRSLLTLSSLKIFCFDACTFGFPLFSLEFFIIYLQNTIEENFIYLAKKYWDQVQNFVPVHLTGGSLIEGWMIVWLTF